VAEGSGVMTFTWEFGDGGTDQGQVVYHAFEKGGPQGVTLTVHSEPCPLVKEVIATLSLDVGPQGPRAYLPLIERSVRKEEAPAPLSLSDPGAERPDRVKGEIAAREERNTGEKSAPASVTYADPSLLGQSAGLQGHAAIQATSLIKVTENTDGVNNQPVVNSDGRRVAFWSTADLLGLGGNQDGNIEVFWADVDDSGSQVQVDTYQVTYSSGTILGGFNLAPAMDHAGTLIAFFSDRDLTGREENKDANYEIFLARLGKRLIIEQLTFTEKGGNILPSLSGDGTHVAFASDRDLDANVFRIRGSIKTN